VKNPQLLDAIATLLMRQYAGGGGGPLRPSMYGKVGVNIGPVSYFDTHLVTPDQMWAGYPYEFRRRQTTLTADHVSGQGWVVADSTFSEAPSPRRTGTVRTVAVRVRDAATSTTLTGTVFSVVGSNVWFPSGSITNDRAVASGTLVDSTDANVFTNNTSFLAIGATFVDGLGRDTGYPSIPTGQVFSGPNAQLRRLPAGVYTPLARGTGDVQFAFTYVDGTTSSNFTVTVTNGVCSPTTVTAAQGITTITVRHRPGDATAPLYDFMLICPDRAGRADNFVASYAANIADPYYFLPHPDYVASLSTFRVLRFMDWQPTNSSTVREWADRTLPGRRPGKNGASYEDAVKVANAVGADPWFCIPHEASDDFVTQFATMLKANLGSSRKVYFEYTNETWNSIFNQYAYCVAQGSNTYSPYALSSLTYSSGSGKCTATLANTTCATLGFSNGDTVVICNATDANYNGEYTISGVSGSSFDYTPGSPPALAAATAQPVTALMAFETSDTTAKTISGIVWTLTSTSADAVVTTSASHGYAAGDMFLISGCSDAGFNGLHSAVSVTTSTITFRFSGTGGTRLLPAISAASTTVNASAAAGQTMRVLRVAANAATGNVKNAFEMNRRWYGRRLGQIQLLFQSVFSGQLSRLAPVVAWQAAGNSTGNDAFTMGEYLAAVGGSLPAGPDFCWAIAPYFGGVAMSDTAIVGPRKTPTAFGYSAGTVTVTLSAHGYTTGDTVQIANVGPVGAGGDAYNGLWTITVSDANTFTYTPVGTPTTTSGLSATYTSPGMMAIKSSPYMRELVTVSKVGTTVTCTSYNHGLTTGEIVRLCNFAQDDYKVTATVTVTDAHTFTFQTASTLTPSANSSAGRMWVLKPGAVDQIFTDTEPYITTTIPGWLAYHRTWAANYGARVVCYEGGPHSLPATAVQNIVPLSEAYIQSNHDARMGAVLDRWFDLLDSYGVSLCCYFNHCMEASKTGTWGLLDYQYQDRSITPKFTSAARR